MAKKNKYLEQAKGTIGLGVGSMAGLSVLGTMSSLPGMPANNVTKIASAGVTLANVGNLANIGMNILPNNTSKKKKKYY